MSFYFFLFWKWTNIGIQIFKYVLLFYSTETDIRSPFLDYKSNTERGRVPLTWQPECQFGEFLYVQTLQQKQIQVWNRNESPVLPNVSIRLHQISPGFLCISLHSLLPSTLTSLLQRGTIMPLGMFMMTCRATWCLVWWPESSILVSVTLDSPSSWLQSPPHAFWKIIDEISRVSCCPPLSRLLFALFEGWPALGPFTAVSYSFHFNTAPLCWFWFINAEQEILFAGTVHNIYILRKTEL